MFSLIALAGAGCRDATGGQVSPVEQGRHARYTPTTRVYYVATEDGRLELRTRTRCSAARCRSPGACRRCTQSSATSSTPTAPSRPRTDRHHRDHRAPV